VCHVPRMLSMKNPTPAPTFPALPGPTRWELKLDLPNDAECAIDHWTITASMGCVRGVTTLSG